MSGTKISATQPTADLLLTHNIDLLSNSPSTSWCHMHVERVSQKNVIVARTKWVWLPLLGAALLTASSYAAVPMYPVPITAQTLTVLLLGVFAGPRWGAFTVLIWIVLAAIGLPVLSGGTGGIEALTGPTAGYIAAFPIAAGMAGYSVRAMSKRPVKLTIVFIALHGFILCLGWTWLLRFVGPTAALESGVTPFVIGAVAKSILAVAVIWTWQRLNLGRSKP